MQILFYQYYYYKLHGKIQKDFTSTSISMINKNLLIHWLYCFNDPLLSVFLDGLVMSQFQVWSIKGNPFNMIFMRKSSGSLNLSKSHHGSYFCKREKDKLDLAFNNVKPKDQNFVLDKVQFWTKLGCVRLTNQNCMQNC